MNYIHTLIRHSDYMIQHYRNIHPIIKYAFNTYGTSVTTYGIRILCEYGLSIIHIKIIHTYCIRILCEWQLHTLNYSYIVHISNHTLSYELSMQIIKNRYYTILICMPVYIWYNRTHLSYILQRILTCVRASYMWNMSINTYGIHIYHIL
jgi:hypothetical protein